MKADFSSVNVPPTSDAAPRFAFFVDIDGVLSDFDTHAKDNGKYGPGGDTLWDLLDLDWWQSMPQYPGAAAFFSALATEGPTRFLTAPVPQVDCFAGKADWVSRFRARQGIDDLERLIICRAVDKNLLARPHHILIDDRQKNIDEWQAAGGIGILHKGDFADTLRRVRDAMAAYAAGPVATESAAPLSAQIFLRNESALQDDGAKAFFDAAKKLGGVRHLGTSKAPAAGFGAEAQWLMDFRPENKRFALLDLIMSPAADISLFARPHHILVDGDANVIASWHKAGGIGIIHRGNYAETLAALQKAAAPFPPPAPRAPFKPKP